MQCIYLTSDGICLATPIKPMNEAEYYKPEPETLTALCKHNYEMKNCPRLLTYQDHLKASQK